MHIHSHTQTQTQIQRHRQKDEKNESKGLAIGVRAQMAPSHSDAWCYVCVFMCSATALVEPPWMKERDREWARLQFYLARNIHTVEGNEKEVDEDKE